jgi:hypothetical protein
VSRGFVKMISKWVIVPIFAVAVLSAVGSSMEVGEETTGRALDQNLGSTSPAITPARVAGSWSLALRDGATGRTEYLDLQLSQVGDVIFGRGETGGTDAFLLAPTDPRPTRDEGISSMVWWLRQDPDPVSTTARTPTIGAAGRVSGERVSLDLMSLEENLLYRLELTVLGSSISGSYTAYDSWGRVRSGSCSGYIRAGYGQAATPVGSGSGIAYLGRTRPF